MDVVAATNDPTQLFVYLANHKRPVVDESNSFAGADSVIEIIRTSLGTEALKHCHTVQDPVIDTPNDLVGSSYG